MPAELLIERFEFKIKKEFYVKDAEIIPINRAIEISTEYEEKFLDTNKDYLHIPRMHIIPINKFENDRLFIKLKKSFSKLLS